MCENEKWAGVGGWNWGYLLEGGWVIKVGLEADSEDENGLVVGDHDGDWSCREESGYDSEDVLSHQENS